jgi:hypothetical protein
VRCHGPNGTCNKLLAVALICAVLLAPQAHATTQDDQFLRSVAAQGIQGLPDQLIAAGHAACDNWGQTMALYSQRLGLQGQFGLSVDQAAGLMWAGVHAYCPDGKP